MLSTELEFCLKEAFQRARDERHEFITVEHLLLALLDTPQVVDILKACGADIARLSTDLAESIDDSTPRMPHDADEDAEPQSTLGFQRVLQRAVFHVQQSGKKEVKPGNVLLAIFSEKQSQAVYLLGLQDVSRLDVVQYLAHKVPKVPKGAGRADEETGDDEAGPGESSPSSTHLPDSTGCAASATASAISEPSCEGLFIICVAAALAGSAAC
jgi:ATP-dependent Clp protease ATP-binding subunit ClpA